VVSEDFILENMLKHKAALSVKPDVDTYDFLKYCTYFHRFFKRFPRSVPRLVEASPAASWQAVRSEGGAREYIRKRLQADLSLPSLISMFELYPGKVESVHGVPAPTLNEVRSYACFGSSDVKVSAVCEPLKVRLITKGDSFKYWFSRFYQKDLWSYLQRFPQFSLTGRPLHELDLWDLLSRERKLDLPFQDWVSGDYSAATDGLNLWYTKGAFETSLEFSKLKDLDKDLLRDVLFEQTVHYPESMVKKSGGALSSFRQTNGQLMGSVLSFPILCTINLVCYWVALENYTKRMIKLEDLPVLVNGDDILFRSNPEFYSLWLEEISKVGFTLSLGKNYVHRKVLTVNSQLYSFSGTRFDFLGYLNTGLLTGQSKLTGRDTAKDAPIWALYNETIPNSVRPSRTHRRFLHYNRELISRASNRGEYNLFLPFSRGGLGFTLTNLVPNEITSFQRRWADFLSRKRRAYVEKDERPPRFSLGLIQERGLSRPLFLRYHPQLSLEPIFGPYNLGILPFEEKEYKYPLLAKPYEFDRPKLSFRFPSKKVKQMFREDYDKGVVLRLSTKKIYTPDLRLCSVRRFTTEDPTYSESPRL
jgi:hypothetical protein